MRGIKSVRRVPEDHVKSGAVQTVHKVVHRMAFNKIIQNQGESVFLYEPIGSRLNVSDRFRELVISIHQNLTVRSKYHFKASSLHKNTGKIIRFFGTPVSV